MVVEWIWRLGNMAFESGVVLEKWRSVVIVPLYNYRGISLLSMVRKIYTELLVDIIHGD